MSVALLGLPGRELVGVEDVTHVPLRAHLLHPAHPQLQHRVVHILPLQAHLLNYAYPQLQHRVVLILPLRAHLLHPEHPQLYHCACPNTSSGTPPPPSSSTATVLCCPYMYVSRHTSSTLNFHSYSTVLVQILLRGHLLHPAHPQLYHCACPNTSSGTPPPPSSSTATVLCCPYTSHGTLPPP
jgi:hypothetical protein